MTTSPGLNERLRGKVAVVTGGAGGLGSAVCRRLVAEGATVVVADIAGEPAARLAAELGGDCSSVQFDYTDAASVQALVHETVARHGRIDLLDNNGVNVSRGDTDLLTSTVVAWDEAYAVNVRGYMLAAKAALPHMIEQGGGVILNMASGAGMGGSLTRPAYGVMKAAVLNLTQQIATQHGKDGVRSVAISPGAMRTESLQRGLSQEAQDIILRHHLTPELGDPGDIAAMVAHLASDEAKFITGINIPIDGGLFAHNPNFADTLAARG